MSYVRRPSRRSNGSPNSLPISAPNTGSTSANGATQPPNLKPPVGSSSGPPGACITPSIETIAPTITFLTGVSPKLDPSLVVYTLGGNTFLQASPGARELVVLTIQQSVRRERFLDGRD